MCGRFLLDSSPAEIAALTHRLGRHLPDVPALASRYNVAPTQQHLVLASDADAPAKLLWTQLRFGFARPTQGLLLNARSETAHRLPTFRVAWRHSRCVAIASGFYEWQATADKGPKQPYLIRAREGGAFALAALKLGGDAFVVVTTAATKAMAPIHARMPAMLQGRRLAAWLDPKTSTGELEMICAPDLQPALALTPVGRHVNNPRHDDPACIAPLKKL